MDQLVLFIAGLLLISESQASDVADRSTFQGFLSKYMPSGNDASKSSMSAHDKFIAPNFKSAKHGNRADALSYHQRPVEHGPVTDSNQEASLFTIVDDRPHHHSMAQLQNLPKLADREEKQAVQKLLANGSNNPISLSAISMGLLSLVTMLGVHLRRRLQAATVLVNSGGLALDMPMSTASALGDNVMEIKAQDSSGLSSRVGWGQLPSQNTSPSTLCYAASADDVRTVAQEASNAVAANSDQASKAAAAEWWKDRVSEVGLADASKTFSTSSTQASKGASQAIDSLAASTVKLGPAAEKAAASISKGADSFASASQDIGARVAQGTGDLSEVLKQASVGFEGADGNVYIKYDGPRLAAAAFDAVGTRIAEGAGNLSEVLKQATVGFEGAGEGAAADAVAAVVTAGASLSAAASANSVASLADASKTFAASTAQASKGASQAIDSLAASTAKLGPAADKAAASISKGADSFASASQDIGARIAEGTGDLSEALNQASVGFEGAGDGARIAAADVFDAVGTAGASLMSNAVASAASSGIGGAEAVSAGAVLLAAAAFSTKGIDAEVVKSLEVDRAAAKQESTMLKEKLEELEQKFLFADAQFEQTMAATKKEFDTSLKVQLDTLRDELTREKDVAILSLKQAQDSQLEELKDYYTERYATKITQMQSLIDAKDARIEELEAALGDPLNLWWKRVTGTEKENSAQEFAG